MLSLLAPLILSEEFAVRIRGYCVEISLLNLTYPQIESSKEISDWLQQFGNERAVAIEMLLRLRFVEEATFSGWLRTELLNELSSGSAAVFAVRKLKKGVDCIWKENGEFRSRPGKSLGSEDLIQGFIANLKKDNKKLYDHPSIKAIKAQRIPRIVLVDDSIGSGNRVGGFVKAMFSNKIFLSRWSLGKLRISVIAFVRMLNAEKNILANVKGSNHRIRKHPAYSKFQVKSYIASGQNHLSQRWGPNYRKILDLCDACDGVPRNRKRGYGNTMANVAFAHSIPNNLPGLLWHQSDKWNALFPQRMVPPWLYTLLGSKQSLPRTNKTVSAVTMTPIDIALLRLIRSGLRRESTIARRIGLDVKVVRDLVLKMVCRGLVTPNHRITEAGRSLLKQQAKPIEKVYNRGLYTPKSWCAD